VERGRPGDGDLLGCRAFSAYKSWILVSQPGMETGQTCAERIVGPAWTESQLRGTDHNGRDLASCPTFCSVLFASFPPKAACCAHPTPTIHFDCPIGYLQLRPPLFTAHSPRPLAPIHSPQPTDFCSVLHAASPSDFLPSCAPTSCCLQSRAGTSIGWLPCLRCRDVSLVSIPYPARRSLISTARSCLDSHRINYSSAHALTPTLASGQSDHDVDRTLTTHYESPFYLLFCTL
jgi:hypothetical protein